MKAVLLNLSVFDTIMGVSPEKMISLLALNAIAVHKKSADITNSDLVAM